jgi:hypothetical protein
MNALRDVQRKEELVLFSKPLADEVGAASTDTFRMYGLVYPQRAPTMIIDKRSLVKKPIVEAKVAI